MGFFGNVDEAGIAAEVAEVEVLQSRYDRAKVRVDASDAAAQTAHVELRSVEQQLRNSPRDAVTAVQRNLSFTRSHSNGSTSSRGMVGSNSSKGTRSNHSSPLVRVRFHIIRNARI